MDDSGAEHRLAAIVSGDVAGYSRLIASDQQSAVRAVTAARELVELLVRQHAGRLVDFTGDNFLAIFNSSLAAVRCAVEIQNVTRARNRGVPDDSQLQFRLGVHQGEVLVDGDRVFGTGVNIAARLEALAEHGGTCISAAVYEQLRGTLEIDCEDLGERSVKNIPDPVHVFRIGDDAEPDTVPSVERLGWGWRAALGFGVATGVALLATGGWYVATTIAAPSASVAENSVEERGSIVILPFSNMSDDPSQEYFADGITEDLTTDLSRVPGLFVIARNSAFTYKGRAVDAEAVGAELGVRYLLEGSVRKAGGSVRINAQLIDTSSGFHVWSDRYDRELRDVFAVQSEITSQILGALQLEITEAELARIRRKPPDDLGAYDLWLQGRAKLRDFSQAGVLEARRMLQRAVELDPSFAEATAELGATYVAEFGGWNPDPALLGPAVAHSYRSLELNPTTPTAHFTLAAVQLIQGDADRALQQAERALDLGPSLFEAYSVLGLTQMHAGKLADSLLTLDKAVKFNPKALDYTWTLLGWAHYRAARFDEATKLWEQVRASNPDAIGDRLSLLHHYQRQGQREEASALLREILASNPAYDATMAGIWLGAAGLPPVLVEDMVMTLVKAGLPPGSVGPRAFDPRGAPSPAPSAGVSDPAV